ncbi:hypothetical protein [Acidisphaera sp. S103]|uniref:hypothetical protein n=1 Tax=Acidisphaera sp. S103 TaxID=1747223 RepID=UPI001C20AA40|nr:hypothetical protein [Acidisphaera sp. S103]
MLDTIPTLTLNHRLSKPGSMTEAITPHDNPLRPDDILMALVVALLAPMFFTVSGADIDVARLAAIQTVNAYRARSQTDLITIAQIIGCGLAALGSLSLSMADDLSLSMTLRLRGNAVALNRAADQNRRALAASQAAPPDTAKPIATSTPLDPDHDATVLANVAAAQKLTAEAMANLRTPEPAPAAVAPPIPPTAPVATPAVVPAAAPMASGDPPISQREWQILLASAMTDVAAEFSAGIANLPPAQRGMASSKAALLSTAASDVILGKTPPPMKPGDLAGFMRSNSA